ncbi:hypothetical protein PVK06_011765 [Gossypium arboreum]|uniref:Uncharacterized protein n=1 Tax=Gossypium arboreum TaxID=29729 RepID=A0ABR0QA02_GOSAR|nr:hypothetical protein PVK06_011765 [Gossypium arboreum]
MFEAHNSDHEKIGIIDDHDEIHGKIQPELVTEDHKDELNIVETSRYTVKVEVRDELNINMELKPIVNKNVKEPIHFLAKEEEIPIREAEEFDSCSFDNGNKDQATETSHNRVKRKLEVIIPQKTI